MAAIPPFARTARGGGLRAHHAPPRGLRWSGQKVKNRAVGSSGTLMSVADADVCCSPRGPRPRVKRQLIANLVRKRAGGLQKVESRRVTLSGQATARRACAPGQEKSVPIFAEARPRSAARLGART